MLQSHFLQNSHFYKKLQSVIALIYFSVQTSLLRTWCSNLEKQISQVASQWKSTLVAGLPSSRAVRGAKWLILITYQSHVVSKPLRSATTMSYRLRGSIPRRSGEAVLIAGIVFFYTIAFSASHDTGGEIMKLYIPFFSNGIIPGVTSGVSPFLQGPTVFVFGFFFTRIADIHPVISLKLIRIVFAVTSTLLVFELAKAVGLSRTEALSAAAIFGLSIYQLNFIAGDQFKNHVGVTFSLGLLLCVFRHINDRRQPFLLTAAILLVTILSHRVYPFFIAVTVAVYLTATVLKYLYSLSFFTGSAISALSFVLGAALTTELILYGIQIGGINLYIPQIAGLFLMSKESYSSVSLINELYQPGILFYNIWLVFSTVGAAVLFRGRRLDSRVKIMVSAFLLLAALSKNYWFSFPLTPGRFQILIPPFLAIFSVTLFSAIDDKIRTMTGHVRTGVVPVGTGALIVSNLILTELSILRSVYSAPLMNNFDPNYVFGAVPSSNVFLYGFICIAAVLAPLFYEAIVEENQPTRLLRRCTIEKGFVIVTSLQLYFWASDQMAPLPVSLGIVAYTVGFGVLYMGDSPTVDAFGYYIVTGLAGFVLLWVVMLLLVPSTTYGIVACLIAMVTVPFMRQFSAPLSS